MAQLLSNLAVGAKVYFGKYSVNGETAQDLVWRIVAKDHSCTPAYPTNSITLVTDKIIDLRCFDAAEVSNSDTNRSNSGNNRYSVSNIDQWLNKDDAGSAWYSPAHSADEEPNTSYLCGNQNTQYYAHTGFLYDFSEDEKNAIQSTTIRVVKPSLDGGSYEDISRKIFLPSATEVGCLNENNIAEGAVWAYFSDSDSRVCPMSPEGYNNTPSSSKPSSVSTPWYWWLRTPYYSISNYVRFINEEGNMLFSYANRGYNGIRPACNLLSTLYVSDTVDADGNYTFVWNSAPSAPSAINVPETVYAERSNVISWTNSTDPDEDEVTYVLECSYDSNPFVQIYEGQDTSYTHTFVPASGYVDPIIQYRVKARDPSGAESAYTTSSTKTFVVNTAPVISGSNSNLGTKTQGFSQTYTIADADGDTVSVVETIDGKTLRSYTATLGATNTFAVTDETWLTQTNGTHTMRIVATDSFGNSAARTYTFTKLVTSFSIMNSCPMESDSMPTRIAVTVNRNIPAEADFLVEVCNNGFDASPTWEDATTSVTGGLVHVFTNTTKTADNWGVQIRVTVTRNDGEGACYVNSIGGNFE